ncbi:hypothetical protein Q31a_57290 [Aureliella helgolandensis]|uniref:Uncharacterized protein n=1 Tax=Aureliella helgolandensis TaxID=2527968 RepID=A0A518GFG4_9BACT|nr:hypothetical protein Q31a_57290 [Aureliella helgolandensis]
MRLRQKLLDSTVLPMCHHPAHQNQRRNVSPSILAPAVVPDRHFGRKVKAGRWNACERMIAVLASAAFSRGWPLDFLGFTVWFVGKREDTVRGTMLPWGGGLKSTGGWQLDWVLCIFSHCPPPGCRARKLRQVAALHMECDDSSSLWSGGLDGSG